MIRFPRSIRARLQLWYGALLVAVLCGFGFTAYHLEKARRFRQIDEGLHTRLSALVDALRAAPERNSEKKRNPEVRLAPAQATLFGGPEGYYYVVWMQGREPVATSAGGPMGVAKPETREAEVRLRPGFREAFLFAAPVNCVLVGCPIMAEERELRTFAGALAAAGFGVLAAGLLGGWWLVTRALQPVEEIGATAARIAAGDLAERIRIREPGSELGRLAEGLNTTFARLEALFAQQARFTADAAHELRTPVAVMLTQTQSALARDRSAAEYRETLEACERASQRMRRLVEALLALAHLDAGQEPLRREDCDLAKIVADGIELVRPLAATRRIEIQAELAPILCRADAERLAQVVVNMLGNALEYNHDGGTVRAVTKREGEAAFFILSNTGPGIAPDDLPHLFERFYRGDKARSAASGHNGLGLAIAKAIVQAHGGSIEVESAPSALTTFTVRLPS